ncbi:MAG: DUF6048 family protein [Paludibacter sp.]|jgi:hypothetical protein|nr:DUF6048 family protein [Paludibacter sp.]
MSKISKYIIFSLLATFCVSTGIAQEKNDSIRRSMSWFKSLQVEIDMASIVKSILANGQTYSYEAALQANILNKYFPVLEAGFAGADYTVENNSQFATSGFFGKLGLDIPLLAYKPDKNLRRNLIAGGLRLGLTNFKYDINNIVINDDYWNNVQIVDYQTQNATKLWFEVVGSLRVEIFKNIFMGWSVKYKSKLGATKPGEISPYYIPGYGVANDLHWDFGYSIGYCF